MGVTAFDRALEIGDKVSHRHNGEPATFAYNNLANTEQVSVIFEKSKELIVLQGETEVVTRRPIAYIQMQELLEKSLPMPKIADQLTIQTVVYDIIAVPDDGHNQIEIHLEKE